MNRLVIWKIFLTPVEKGFPFLIIRNWTRALFLNGKTEVRRLPGLCVPGLAGQTIILKVNTYSRPICVSTDPLALPKEISTAYSLHSPWDGAFQKKIF